MAVVISRTENNRLGSPLPDVMTTTSTSSASPSAATALKNAMMQAAAAASSLTLPSKPVARCSALIAQPVSKASSASSMTKATTTVATSASSKTVAVKQRQQEGAIVMRNRSKPRSPPASLPLRQEKQEDVHTHDVGDDEEETRDGVTRALVRDLAVRAQQQKEEEARLLSLKRLLDTELAEETFIFSDEAEELLTELEKDPTSVSLVKVKKEEEEDVSSSVTKGVRVGSVDNKKGGRVNTSGRSEGGVSRRKRGRETKRDVQEVGRKRNAEGERPAKRARKDTTVATPKQQPRTKRAPIVASPDACESIFEMECVSVRIESTDNSASCSSVEEDDSDAGWAFGADVEEEEEDTASPPSPSSPATFSNGAGEEEEDVIELDVDVHVDRHGNVRFENPIACRRSARLHSGSSASHGGAVNSVAAKRRAARREKAAASQNQARADAKFYNGLGPGVCGLLAAVEEDRADLAHQKDLRFVDYDLMLLRLDAKEQEEDLCKEVKRTRIDFRDDVEILQKDLGYALDVMAAQCNILMAEEDAADAEAVRQLEAEAASMRRELAREVEAIRGVCKSDNSVVQLALLKQMEQVQSCVEAEYRKCIAGVLSDQAAARQATLLQIGQFRTQCQKNFGNAQAGMEERVALEKRRLHHAAKRVVSETTAIQACLLPRN